MGQLADMKAQLEARSFSPQEANVAGVGVGLDGQRARFHRWQGFVPNGAGCDIVRDHGEDDVGILNRVRQRVGKPGCKCGCAICRSCPRHDILARLNQSVRHALAHGAETQKCNAHRMHCAPFSKGEFIRRLHFNPTRFRCLSKGRRAPTTWQLDPDQGNVAPPTDRIATELINHKPQI